jgi:hypothetical protein
MASTFVLAAHLGARVFRRAIENGARVSKIRSRQTRNRLWIKESQGWDLAFVFAYAGFVVS